VGHGSAGAVGLITDLGGYVPQLVHGAESGLLMASIIFAAVHVFVLMAAGRANPTT
jgi:hypothetical protein